MSDVILFDKPAKSDGMALYHLVKSCPPLDLNSSYLYFLQATHFADTCITAKRNDELIGFVSGYLHPNEANTLFIWQVAVAESARGQGLATKLLANLIQRPNLNQVNKVITTISPSNQASQKVFTSIAKHMQWTCSTSEFLTEQDFHTATETHEAEVLYSLYRPDQKSLVESFHSVLKI